MWLAMDAGGDVRPSTYMGYTPVTQRVEGYPFGECVRATYAAILNIPIEVVPRFDPASLSPGERQGDRERRWLASIGIDLIEISVPHDEELPQEALDDVPQIEHLISGVSPRGFGHRCVGFGGSVLWDPHPSRAGLVTVYSVGFLVPLERDFQ